MIDALIKETIKKQSVAVVGLDTALDYLPGEMREKVGGLKECADAIFEFNRGIIDATQDIIAGVKVQVAYYEAYGYEGMRAFKNTLDYAKSKGLITIADRKRNDIGATAKKYAEAYLGRTQIGEEKIRAFSSDFVTLNGYLGSDGIKPFTAAMKEYGGGGFVLVRTSNPSGGEVQNLKLNSGECIYEAMGELVSEWGKDLIGEYGYSALGGVVGATHVEEAAKLREMFKKMYFLIPGYGAQGGKAEDLAVCFDKEGMGGVVNSSRGILLAYRSGKYGAAAYDLAAREAVKEMNEDILCALKKRGTERVGG